MSGSGWQKRVHMGLYKTPVLLFFIIKEEDTDFCVLRLLNLHQYIAIESIITPCARQAGIGR